jgi:hypothetical protein
MPPKGKGKGKGKGGGRGGGKGGRGGGKGGRGSKAEVEVTIKTKDGKKKQIGVYRVGGAGLGLRVDVDCSASMGGERIIAAVNGG